MTRLTQRAKQRPSGTGASGLPIDSYRDDDVEAQDAAQRQQLLSGTEMLERGSQRLADSTRLALETEDVGASILQDLRRQREQIEHSRDTVRLRLTHSSTVRTCTSTARRGRCST